ncbi:MAG: lipoprotein-releasing system ATP-binding protein LolD, partial [Planctomycetota bacterium]
QAMRCALARALLPGPACLIADEPTGTLDSQTAEAIAAALLQRTRCEHITLILSTHDHDLAAQCDQHLHLHEGVLHASARFEPA